MPRIQPFTGLVYAPSAGDPTALTAPPYDAITDEERQAYLAANPHNVVRLILGDEHRGDDDRENKYTRAGALLRTWREAGVLVETPEPSVFVYEMAFERDGPRRVRGLIAAIELEPFGEGIVPHERTMPGPIDDRLRLIRQARANLSPVYAVLRGPCPPQRAVIERAGARRPDLEATDPSGVVHRLWIEPGIPEELVQAYAGESLLIADGHHRYTTALAYREEMREAHGPGPWDAMMLLVVEAVEDPPVLPIHRVIRGADVPAPGFAVGSLEEALRIVSDEDLRFAVATSNGDGVSFRVARLDGGDPPTVVAIHDRILSRYPEAEVGFEADAERAVAAAAGGATTYLLPPTHVDAIRAVIERGDRLPQKSTWFWPKPRTGMVIRPLD
ncbi:MAG: DUF1015 domain-containing protein [Actinomycetota bacterium]